jgi:hypothetical protein
MAHLIMGVAMMMDGGRLHVHDGGIIPSGQGAVNQKTRDLATG